MKKFRVIYLIYLIIITAISFAPAKETSARMDKVSIYFADKQMMRLVPMEYYIKSDNPGEQCQAILRELTRERDYNSNIRRILPGDNGAITVKVNENIATVNIKSEYFAESEKVKAMEELIVYQIVNSISSVEGVSRVKFLIDGKVKKDFFGFVDMREAFVPDYYV